jgi:hypothetical protein
MAKKNVRIPQKLLGELSRENRKWFEFYENHPSAPGKAYRSKARKFLEYKKHNQKPFPAFDDTDVQIFIEMLKSAGYGSGINGYIGAISGLAERLRTEFTQDFRPSFLTNISRFAVDEESKSSGIVLTQRQISLIKKYTLEKGSELEIYFFEKLFRQGVQLERLQIIGQEEFGEDIDFIYQSRQYFKRVTRYLKSEENINAEHFKLSHQAYFFKCPNCEKETENIAENWVLIRTEFDDEYRLVCAGCKGKKK